MMRPALAQWHLVKQEPASARRQSWSAESAGRSRRVFGACTGRRAAWSCARSGGRGARAPWVGRGGGGGGVGRGRGGGMGGGGGEGEGLGGLAADLARHGVLDDADGDAGNVTARGALAAQARRGGRVGDP